MEVLPCCPAPTMSGFFWNKDETEDNSMNALLKSLPKAALLFKCPTRAGVQGCHPAPSKSTLSLLQPTEGRLARGVIFSY